MPQPRVDTEQVEEKEQVRCGEKGKLKSALKNYRERQNKEKTGEEVAYRLNVSSPIICSPSALSEISEASTP